MFIEITSDRPKLRRSDIWRMSLLRSLESYCATCSINITRLWRSRIWEFAGSIKCEGKYYLNVYNRSLTGARSVKTNPSRSTVSPIVNSTGRLNIGPSKAKL
jgi:hypothetical protein